MRNFFGLFFVLGIVPVCYSQGNHPPQVYYNEIDSVVSFQFRIDISNSYKQQDKKRPDFHPIVEDFNNSQQQIAKPLSYREEIERRQKEEMANFNKMINDRRVEAFTNIIGLTEQESTKFWPLYNDYLQKLDKIYDKRETAINKLCDIYSNLNDSQLAIWADVYSNSFEEESTLMKQHKEKFKAILGKKFPLLYSAEYQFKLWILRTF